MINTNKIKQLLKEKYTNEDMMREKYQEIQKLKGERISLGRENGLIDTKIRGELGMIIPKQNGGSKSKDSLHP